MRDGEKNYPDWIELHNPNNTALDLTGYYLSDNPALPKLLSQFREDMGGIGRQVGLGLFQFVQHQFEMIGMRTGGQLFLNFGIEGD